MVICVSIAIAFVLIAIGVLINCYVNACERFEEDFDVEDFVLDIDSVRAITAENYTSNLECDVDNVLDYCFIAIRQAAKQGHYSVFIDSFDIQYHVLKDSDLRTVLTLVKNTLAHKFGYEIQDCWDYDFKILW